MPEFMGRIWLDSESVVSIETWCYELEPTDLTRIGVAEWGRNHFTECYSFDDIRGMFEIKEDGNYQILFKATLEGHRDYWGEYDEDLQIVESSSVKIPDNWFDVYGELDVHG